MVDDAYPIITTPDLTRALAFYRDVLGAEVAYSFPDPDQPDYVGLRLGRGQLGLGRDPRPAGTATSGGPGGPDGQRFSLWLYVDDCDAATDLVRRGGATVVAEPADQPWGERVARVLDPDGNELLLGQSGGEEA